MKLKIALFIFMTFFFLIVLAIIQQTTCLSYEYITLPQFAPAIAVLFFSLIYKNSVIPINVQFDNKILKKIFFVLILPVGLFSITFFIGKQLGLNVQITANISTLLPMALAGMLVGAIGEEVGWRSFLQPFFERYNTALLSSVFVGLSWGMWHVGHYKNGVLFMFGFLLFAISASIIMAWLLRKTNYNLIISALFHFSINICFLTFFKNSLTDSNFMLINGIIWAVFATVIILINGKNLEKPWQQGYNTAN